jgi:RNA polymerase sigma-70 factor (ECF subfamily)
MRLRMQSDSKAPDPFSDRFRKGGHGPNVLLPAFIDARQDESRAPEQSGEAPELTSPRSSASASRFRSLVDRYFDFVWRSLRRLGVPSSDVDDAAQEVFVVVARRLEQVSEERERSFLFGTALRVASTRRRGRRRHPEELDAELDEHPHADLDPEELTELALARPRLQAILDGMPAELRSVFVLSELEELTMRDIASLLRLPEGTVASRLRAARERFRAGIKRLEAHDAFVWRKR